MSSAIVPTDPDIIYGPYLPPRMPPISPQQKISSSFVTSASVPTDIYIYMRQFCRPECLLPTPQREFFSSVASSASIPIDPDIFDHPFLPPRMLFTHTTAIILIDFCPQPGPITSGHAVLFTTKFPLPKPQQEFHGNVCFQPPSVPAMPYWSNENAPYLHHSIHSH